MKDILLPIAATVYIILFIFIFIVYTIYVIQQRKEIKTFNEESKIMEDEVKPVKIEDNNKNISLNKNEDIIDTLSKYNIREFNDTRNNKHI